MEPRRYIVAVLLLAAVAWPILALINALFNLSPCRIDLYERGENYVSSCEDKRFGDFEHQVFYHGMLDTDRRLREADVIFLGDSRVGFAFSHPNIETFFSERGARFLVASFGYAEGWQFAADVLKRHQSRPTMLVINVAPFFNGPSREFSEPARYVTSHPIGSYVEALFAEVAQPIYSYFCPKCGKSPSMIRSRLTGQWDWRTFDLANGVGVFPLKVIPDPPHEAIAAWADVAEAQARQLLSYTHARCVVFTDVPHDGAVGVFARELGRRLSVPVVLPEVPSTRSFDRQHLDGHSSVSWTNALLAQLEAIATSQCGGGWTGKTHAAAVRH